MSPPEQMALLAPESPEAVIARAAAEHGPFVATVCLFSGGHDSTVLAHRCRDHYADLAFIDTGTAVPGVRDFVERFAALIDKPLRVYGAGDAFRHMVLGGGARPSDGQPHVALGFPGPAQHGRAYARLKERQLREMMRDLKTGHPRNARVLYLSGVRRAESTRRRERAAVTRLGAMTFACPLIDWGDAATREYRGQHALPESDAAALLHRSGECCCGAFAEPGEREQLRDLWPAWFDRVIGSLEREAEAQGLAACRWGQRPPGAPPTADAGPLCTSCAYRQEALL